MAARVMIAIEPAKNWTKIRRELELDGQIFREGRLGLKKFKRGPALCQHI